MSKFHNLVLPLPNRISPAKESLLHSSSSVLPALLGSAPLSKDSGRGRVARFLSCELPLDVQSRRRDPPPASRFGPRQFASLRHSGAPQPISPARSAPR